MKKVYSLATLFVLITATLAFAQDEGTIIKKERIEKSKGIFIGAGPSLTFGKNIGDYSAGFNVEAGFLKRLNRVLSIGPSISYTSFKYDPKVTSVNGGGAYVDIGDPNGWGAKYGLNGLSYIYGYALELKGGDISITSLAFNLKLNFVPIKDDSKISIYGFAKPFIAMASRKAVTGSDARYTYEIVEDDNGTSATNDDLLYYNLGDDTWYPDGTTSTWGPNSYPALKSDTEITGGISIGPGIEFVPGKGVSFYAQAAFGYTFPITFVSTEAYEKTVTAYSDEKFPMVKKGFPSLNFQFGVSFNF